MHKAVFVLSLIAPWGPLVACQMVGCVRYDDGSAAAAASSEGIHLPVDRERLPLEWTIGYQIEQASRKRSWPTYLEKMALGLSIVELAERMPGEGFGPNIEWDSYTFVVPQIRGSGARYKITMKDGRVKEVSFYINHRGQDDDFLQQKILADWGDPFRVIQGAQNEHVPVWFSDDGELEIRMDRDDAGVLRLRYLLGSKHR